jgi:glycosyltransferase involved in cell wall biosynthesis
VSVIVIFHNEERFLPEAVASVQAQTFRDWELLLVDDGSTDGSPSLARAVARACPDRIRYFSHPDHENRGMSATRNLGLRHARGAFIAFLDADDVWYPDKLERQVALLDANPLAELVIGRKEYWYSWSGRSEDAERDFRQPLDIPLDRLIEPPRVLIAFLRNQWASPSDLLLRRSAVDAVGGYENEFRGMFEDQAFCAKLCANYPVFVSSGSWYRYRQHLKSCVATSEAQGSKDQARRRFLEWLIVYVDAKQIANRDLRSALRGEMTSFRYPGFTRARRRFWRFRQELKAKIRSALWRRGVSA